MNRPLFRRGPIFRVGNGGVGSSDCFRRGPRFVISYLLIVSDIDVAVLETRTFCFPQLCSAGAELYFVKQVRTRRTLAFVEHMNRRK
jgi:hypothetical protein